MPKKEKEQKQEKKQEKKKEKKEDTSLIGAIKTMRKGWGKIAEDPGK